MEVSAVRLSLYLHIGKVQPLPSQSFLAMSDRNAWLNAVPWDLPCAGLSSLGNLEKSSDLDKQGLKGTSIPTSGNKKSYDLQQPRDALHSRAVMTFRQGFCEYIQHRTGRQPTSGSCRPNLTATIWRQAGMFVQCQSAITLY